ncbi:MAG: hypothetical protein JW871_00335 [Endomicrobiales bacterium]|nr:hypothetical protein [Endomicrobiales bacterium]
MADVTVTSNDNYIVDVDNDNDSSEKLFKVTHDNGTELFRIQENGRVGIGTSSPACILHIGDTSSGNYLIIDGSQSYIELRDSGNSKWQIGHDVISGSNSDLQISSNTAGGVMTILQSNGRVGIGTTSPGTLLQVGDTSHNGVITIDGTQSYIRLLDSGTEKWQIGHDVGGGSSSDFHFYSLGLGGTAVAILQSSGNVGIGTISPQAKLDVRGGALFNGDGGDNDFRIEGDSDNNLFFCDAGNDRVGIGTNSPSAKLHIEGTAYLSGVVGIGTSSPSAQLHVLVDYTAPALILDTGTGEYAPASTMLDFYYEGSKKWSLYSYGEDETDTLNIQGNEGTGPYLTITQDRKVGIDNDSPQYKLDVDGDINTSGDIRKSGTAYNNPDYVFEINYELMDLKVLEEFVKNNKHLPKIFSTQEIKERGIRLFEHNRLLLEKLEEAYLYIFQLSKRINILESVK